MPLTFDQIESVAEEEERRSAREGRGGGGGKKRSSVSATSKAARARDIANSRQEKSQQSKEDLLGVLQIFPEFENKDHEDRFIGRYLAWVNSSLESKAVVLNDATDLEYKFTTSSKGAGGQNVNKVASAAICRHVVTGISVRNQETRDQSRNKEKARAILCGRLAGHINDWESYLGEGKSLTNDIVLELLLEAG